MAFSINLEKELRRTQRRLIQEKSLKNILGEIFETHTTSQRDILNRLESEQVDVNSLCPELLNPELIIHEEAIRRICVKYRLRFLKSHLFKGPIPVEALQKIQKMERLHKSRLHNFNIIAPSGLFKLENADDPILLASLGNGYHYIIHKWGKDLRPWRVVWAWPFKSLENLAILLLAVSLMITLLLPNGMLSQAGGLSERFLIFLFIFKGLAGIVIFYGFALGKNFNTEIWNSKLYNA